MAQCSNGETDEFVTCGVCFIEYNNEEKKPKILQCFHTLCLQCLKQICRNGSISCPFCRKTFDMNDVSAVPNNSYALHMLKLKEKKVEEPRKAILNSFVVGWCFTCNGAEKPDCAPLAHSTAKMSADSIRDLDSLLILQEELLKTKDQKTDNLTKAIEKRLQVQEKLSVIMKSIKTAENNVKQLQDENNLRLTEMISTLDRINNRNIKPDKAKPEDEKEDLFIISELINVVEDSIPDDTAETARLKMAKSVKLSEEKLKEATALASEYDLQETMKTVIQLFDDKDRPIATGKWLENGFRLQPDNQPLMSSEIRQELLLINHVITSFVRKQNVLLESEQPATAPTQDTTQSLLRIHPLPANQFVLGQLPIFILRLFRSKKQIGEVHIRPVPTFHPELVQKMGEFCKKSPKLFCRDIGIKGEKNVYVSMAMSHPQFQLNFPMLTPNKSAAISKAENVDEVGVRRIFSIKDSTGKNPVLGGWNFVFPLKYFQSPNFEQQTKKKKCQLFGYVMQHQMMNPLTELSALSFFEKLNVWLTLESI